MVAPSKQDVEWRPIPGAPNTYASYDGRIMLPSGKISTAKPNEEGYIRVTVCGRLQYAHILVAKAWLPNPNKLPLVDHRDRIRHHNAVPNLRWTSHSGNSLNSDRTKIRKDTSVLQCTSDEVVREWDTPEEAVLSIQPKISKEALKKTLKAIQRCCNGSETTVLGFSWRHKRDQPIEGEIWKELEVTGKDGKVRTVKVSSKARVKRADGKVVVGSDHKKYTKIGLYGTMYYMHVLVCSAFHGECPGEGMTVDHKDGKGRNNDPSNLHWAEKVVQDNNKSNSVVIVRTDAKGKEHEYVGYKKATKELSLSQSAILRLSKSGTRLPDGSTLTKTTLKELRTRKE